MSWPRPYYQAGGGNAQLFFKVHGDFSGGLKISRKQHRTSGPPDGTELYQHDDPASSEFLFGLDGTFGELLRESDPALFEAASKSPTALALRGEVQDPPTLDYFRNAVGLVAALLEAGGVAVFDPHMLKWWTPSEWREVAFEPDAPAPREHVVILFSEDDDGRWYHTRGMIKFGRPDLSVRDVPKKLYAPVEDLLNRFIEMQAQGAVVPDGQPIKMKGLPTNWICRHTGSFDDPDFNNVHLAIGEASRADEDRGA